MILEKLKKNKYIYLSFIVPLMIMLFVMLTMQIAPFGKYSLLVSDCDAQYIDRITGFRNVFLKGKSYLYTWSQIQGSTPFAFMGIDPFYFLYLLVSEEQVVDMVTIVTTLKIACAGLTCGIYLRKAFKRNDMSISIFAWCYALMGFSIAYHFLLGFEDAVILLPLVLWGVEQLLEDNKKYLCFTIPLALSFIIDFYMAYMMGIYAFIYFCYRYALINRSLNKKEMIRKIIYFFVSPLLAFGCSAFLLVPIFSMMTGRDGLFVKSNFSLYLRYDFAALFSKLFIGSYDTVLPNGLPYIYCGIIVLILVGVFFTSRLVAYKEKIFSFCLLAFMILSLTFNPLYVAWHGFKPPVYFEGRFSYLVSFTMIFLAYRGFCQINTMARQDIHKIFLILGGAYLLLDRRVYTFIKDDSLLYCLLFLAGYYLVIMVLLKGNYPRRKAIMLLSVIVAFELLSNTSGTIKNLDEQLHYPEKSDYIERFNEMNAITTDIKASDPDFYRMEFVEKRGLNDGFGVGFPSISHFDSTYNYDVKQMIDRLGVSTGHNWIQYEGTTPIVDALLNIKYVTAKQKDYFGYEQVGGKEETYIFKNPYALSVGFMVKEDLNGLDEQLDAFELQTTLLNKMLGEKDHAYFEPLQVNTPEKINSEQRIIEDEAVRDDLYYVKDLNQNAYLCLKTKAVEDGPCFMHIESDQYNLFSVLVNDELCHECCRDGSETIYLGYFNKGEILDIKIQFLDKVFEYRKIQLMQMKEAEVKEAFEQLAQQKIEISKQKETLLEGKIQVTDEKGYLFTSIPFEEGWQVQVDGKVVQTMPIFGHFLGIKLSKGVHEITLQYVPKGLKAGVTISLGTCLVLGALIIYRKTGRGTKYRKK